MRSKPTDYVTRADFPEVKDWSKWDEIVNKTKREIADLLKRHKHLYNNKKAPTINQQRITVYIYNKDGMLTNTFNGLKQVCNHFQVSLQTAVRYSLFKWIVKEHLLSRDYLTADEAKEIYNDRLAHGKVLFSLSSGNIGKTKPIYGYNKDGQLVGVYDSAVIWTAKITPNTNVIQYSNFADERKINDIMYSYNRYDTDEAKERYINSKTKILKQ